MAEELFFAKQYEKCIQLIGTIRQMFPGRNLNLGFIHALIDQMKYDPLLQHTNFTHTKLRQEIVQTLPKIIEKGLVQDWTLGQPVDLNDAVLKSKGWPRVQS